MTNYYPKVSEALIAEIRSWGPGRFTVVRDSNIEHPDHYLFQFIPQGWDHSDGHMIYFPIRMFWGSS